MWDDENAQSHPQRGSRNTVGGYYGNRSSGVNSSETGSNQTNLASNAQSSGDGDTTTSTSRETYQSQGSYTRVTPDPKKRDKLQNQRTSELERLEAYKEKQKLGHVSMTPGRVGGAKISEEAARRQQQKEQQERKYEMIRKREQWAKEKRAREEKEYAEKKTMARQQTDQNKQREQERQRERQAERQDWITRGGLGRLQGGSREGGANEASCNDKGAEDFEIDESAVKSLKEIFPFKDLAKLRNMLGAAKGDVNTVIDWLSD